MLRTTATRAVRVSRARAGLRACMYSTDVPATKEDKAPTYFETATEAASMQAPNRAETWAESQQPKSEAFKGPRFAQKDLLAQPQPFAAIDLIAEEPVRQVHGRMAVCDGGRGAQGHPKVYINLDLDGPNSCTYCGLRFQQAHHH
ncbi:zinc-finger domain-containing protein [Dipodascopsis tothii]|uniref:zinc-finger domain-containing protein n=1 Tax=Dipodascopsis tothii TaxID=44089 RepID=UPI0034CF6CCD